MAACVPYYQWLGANAACRAKSAGISVQGFGYARTGVAGLRGLGLRGLGDTWTNLIPTPPGPNVVQGTVTAPVVSQPSLNTTPVYDPSDPCYIAQQTPCPAGTGCPAECPTGYHSVSLLVGPGKPAQCVCAQTKSVATPSNGSATAPPSGGAGPVLTTTPILQSNAAAGGFSHWGLLAAVAGVGLVGYLVMKKKKAA